MADPFDSVALFAEFNRPREPSDKILLTKLKTNTPPKGFGRPENGVSTVSERRDDSESGSESDDGEDSSDDERDEEEEEKGDTADENLGPVEIGRDTSGSIIYRPGERERKLGQRLLEKANYGPAGGLGDIRGEDEAQHRLRAQNFLYRRQTRIIDPTRHVPATEDQDSPAIQLLYMNHNFARKYRADIENFIQDLLQRDRDDEHMKETRLRPHHICLAEGSSEVKDQEVAIHEHRTSTVIGCSRFYRDFTVDSMGFPLVDYIPALSYGWEIPRYQQQFPKVLPIDSDSEDEDVKPPKPGRSRSACFNCGGNHRLNECQEQRDMRRIAENRQKFQAAAAMAQGSLTKGSGRQMEDDPRFSNFTPGVYSDNLREALGLRSNQVPPFVYRMRVLGYPPGYLQEAQIERSGITMFDKDGQALRSEVDNADEPNLEDGEMEEENKVLYNTDKLIDFPGFNVPLPKGVADESEKYGLPPMMPSNTKEVMMKNLPTPQGVKRQSSESREGAERGRKRMKVEDVDMDLDQSEAEDSHSDLAMPQYEVAVAPVWWNLPIWTHLPFTSYSFTNPPPPAHEEAIAPQDWHNHNPPPSPPPPLPPDSPPRSLTPPPPPPGSPPVSPQSNIVLSGEHSSGVSEVEFIQCTSEKAPYEKGSPQHLIVDRLLPLEADDLVETQLSRSSSYSSFSRSGKNTPTLEDLEAQRQVLQQLVDQADSQDSVSSFGGTSSQKSSRASSIERDSHKFTIPQLPSAGRENPPLPGGPPPETPPKPPLPPGTPPVTPHNPPLPDGEPPMIPPTPPLPEGTPPVTPRMEKADTIPMASTPVDLDDSFLTPVNRSANSSLNLSSSASIGKSLGTPVRKVCTEDLPDSDKFSQGVQDHIPFENLPDATGRYDKMKDIIASIRRLKKKSQ